MPKKLYCVVKCFFRDRLWKPGETLVIQPGEVNLPPAKWFAEKPTTKQVNPVEVAAATLRDIQRQEARDTLDGVGHGKQAAVSTEQKPEEAKAAEANSFLN